MSKPNITKGEDGKYYMELHDPDDERHRSLNPTSGTETDHHWPGAEPEVPPPPLLDLEEAWKFAKDGILIPTPGDPQNDPDPDVLIQNARILVRELKFYILASNMFEDDADTSKPKENEEEFAKEGNEASTEASLRNKPDSPGDVSLSHAEKLVNDDNGQRSEIESGDKNNTKQTYEQSGLKTEEDTEKITKGRKSSYGASILLKLQWEERSKQKLVPKQTYSQLGHFIVEIIAHLEELLSVNPAAAKPIFGNLALDITPIMFARLLDGKETQTEVLEVEAMNFLMLCARQSNPKEMHVGITGFTSKIDSVYMAATSYLVYDPLVRIWTTVILRIPRKRSAFLKDFIKIFDKMATSAEGWEQLSVAEDGGYGVEKSGRCDQVPQLTYEFLTQLVDVQNEHRSSSSAISDKVDILGRVLPTFSMSRSMDVDDTKEKHDSTPEKDVGNDDLGDDDGENTAQHDDLTAEAQDWVQERAITLARVLRLQAAVWEKLSPPPGEDRNMPRRKKKTPISRGKKVSMQQEEAEDKVYNILSMIKKLGWTNPVLACQVAWKSLSLETVRCEDEQISIQIGEDVRSKKEKKNTLYSIASVGYFLCAWLRPRTRTRMGDGHDNGNKIDDYDVRLSGTGFDLLSPDYAFHLTLPFTMALIGQSSIATIMAALIVVRHLVDRLPDKSLKTLEDILQVRCGTPSMGREVSIFGLAQQIGRAIGLMDDPGHRRYAYETLQLIIRRCAHPIARYDLAEAVFVDATRVALAAQFVTEMKDAIRYSDALAWDHECSDSKGKNIGWNSTQASELKTRFVHVVVPKYFTPRKGMIGSISAIVAASNACLYVAGSDRRHTEVAQEISKEKRYSDVQHSIAKRNSWLKAYVKLGKDCVRALAAVAEHDRKTVPKSKLVKDSPVDAKALFEVSGQTLNQCVGALGSLDKTLELLM